MSVDNTTLPETTYVVIHWHGNIPVRANRLDNPTAAELLREQMCLSYGRFTTVQTLTGAYAEKLYAMLRLAFAGTSMKEAGTAIDVT